MVKQFISNLWLDYSVRLCPSSSNIHRIVSDYGIITNDHFALRTLNLPKINEIGFFSKFYNSDTYFEF